MRREPDRFALVTPGVPVGLAATVSQRWRPAAPVSRCSIRTPALFARGAANDRCRRPATLRMTSRSGARCARSLPIPAPSTRSSTVPASCARNASARPSARRSIGSSTPIQSARSMFARRQSRHCDRPRARSSPPRQHRRITSSARAHRPSPHPAIHAATKGAVESHTKALSAEPAPVGVRVNAVDPSPVRTRISLLSKRCY